MERVRVNTPCRRQRGADLAIPLVCSDQIQAWLSFDEYVSVLCLRLQAIRTHHLTSAKEEPAASISQDQLDVCFRKVVVKHRFKLIDSVSIDVQECRVCSIDFEQFIFRQ